MKSLFRFSAGFGVIPGSIGLIFAAIGAAPWYCPLVAFAATFASIVIIALIVEGAEVLKDYD